MFTVCYFSFHLLYILVLLPFLCWWKVFHPFIIHIRQCYSIPLYGSLAHFQLIQKKRNSSIRIILYIYNICIYVFYVNIICCLRKKNYSLESVYKSTKNKSSTWNHQWLAGRPRRLDSQSEMILLYYKIKSNAACFQVVWNWLNSAGYYFSSKGLFEKESV